jgi:hypothetical protein
MRKTDVVRIVLNVATVALATSGMWLLLGVGAALLTAAAGVALLGWALDS